MKREHLVGAAVLTAALATFAGGCGDDEVAAPPLRVSDTFAPEPPLGLTALYFTIENRSDVDDRLRAVLVDGGTVEGIFTTTITADGAERMRQERDGLTLPARSRVELKPGGSHVMVDGLEGVTEGQQLRVTLDLAIHNDLTIVVPVGALGSTEPPR